MVGKGRHAAHVRRVAATMASSLEFYFKREVSPPSFSLFLYIAASYYTAISFTLPIYHNILLLELITCEEEDTSINDHNAGLQGED